MRYFIILLLLCSLATLAGDSVDKLENQYFSKLEQLKKDYEAKTLALANSYKTQLLKIRTDKAISKYAEIKLPPKPSIVGEWHWHHGVINKFLVGGKAEQYLNEKRVLVGSWSKNKDGTYQVRYPTVGAAATYTVTKETMIKISSKSKYIDGRRILRVTN